MENIIAFRGETRKLLLPIRQDNQGITGELPLVAIQRLNNDYFYESAWSATAPKRGAITVYANPGGGKTTCTSVGHTLVNGNKVFIRGTTNYDNPTVSYTVSGVAGNDFDIDTAFVADDGTGDWYFGFDPMVAEGAVPKPGLYSRSFTLLATADKYIVHYENNDVNGFGLNEYNYLIANMSETGERNVSSVFTNTGIADDVDMSVRKLKIFDDTGGKSLEILQRTKTVDEDIIEIGWSKIAGKSTLGNTGGGNEIEEKYYNYAEGAVVKTNTILKPGLTDNTGNLDVNAMAGKYQK